MSLAPADLAKRAAAARALEMVEDGMMLGLGTGSTAGWFVRLLSERIRHEGLSVEGVATSSATVWLAEELGVPLRRLEDVGGIDLTVDGADEIDARLNLIKGGGAALLQEKIVAAASCADGGDRRRQQARRPARRLPAAGRDRPLRLDGDAPPVGRAPGRHGRRRPRGRVPHGRRRAAGHRRGPLHPRPAPRPDRRPAGAGRGAELSARSGGERALHRHGALRHPRPRRRHAPRSSTARAPAAPTRWTSSS